MGSLAGFIGEHEGGQFSNVSIEELVQAVLDSRRVTRRERDEVPITGGGYTIDRAGMEEWRDDVRGVLDYIASTDYAAYEDLATQYEEWDPNGWKTVVGTVFHEGDQQLVDIGIIIGDEGAGEPQEETPGIPDYGKDPTDQPTDEIPPPRDWPETGPPSGPGPVETTPDEQEPQPPGSIGPDTLMPDLEHEQPTEIPGKMPDLEHEQPVPIDTEEDPRNPDKPVDPPPADVTSDAFYLEMLREAHLYALEQGKRMNRPTDSTQRILGLGKDIDDNVPFETPPESKAFDAATNFFLTNLVGMDKPLLIELLVAMDVSNTDLAYAWDIPTVRNVESQAGVTRDGWRLPPGAPEFFTDNPLITETLKAHSHYLPDNRLTGRTGKNVTPDADLIRGELDYGYTGIPRVADRSFGLGGDPRFPGVQRHMTALEYQVQQQNRAGREAREEEFEKTGVMLDTQGFPDVFLNQLGGEETVLPNRGEPRGGQARVRGDFDEYGYGPRYEHTNPFLPNTYTGWAIELAAGALMSPGGARLAGRLGRAAVGGAATAGEKVLANRLLRFGHNLISPNALARMRNIASGSGGRFSRISAGAVDEGAVLQAGRENIAVARAAREAREASGVLTPQQRAASLETDALMRQMSDPQRLLADPIFEKQIHEAVSADPLLSRGGEIYRIDHDTVGIRFPDEWSDAGGGPGLASTKLTPAQESGLVHHNLPDPEMSGLVRAANQPDQIARVEAARAEARAVAAAQPEATIAEQGARVRELIDSGAIDDSIFSLAPTPRSQAVKPIWWDQNRAQWVDQWGRVVDPAEVTDEMIEVALQRPDYDPRFAEGAVEDVGYRYGDTPMTGQPAGPGETVSIIDDGDYYSLEDIAEVWDTHIDELTEQHIRDAMDLDLLGPQDGAALQEALVRRNRVNELQIELEETIEDLVRSGADDQIDQVRAEYHAAIDEVNNWGIGHRDPAWPAGANTQAEADLIRSQLDGLQLELEETVQGLESAGATDDELRQVVRDYEERMGQLRDWGPETEADWVDTGDFDNPASDYQRPPIDEEPLPPAEPQPERRIRPTQEEAAERGWIVNDEQGFTRYPAESRSRMRNIAGEDMVLYDRESPLWDDLWERLQQNLPEHDHGNWMYMGSTGEIGEEGVRHAFKNSHTRRYITVDDAGTPLTRRQVFDVHDETGTIGHDEWIEGTDALDEHLTMMDENPSYDRYDRPSSTPRDFIFQDGQWVPPDTTPGSLPPPSAGAMGNAQEWRRQWFERASTPEGMEQALSSLEDLLSGPNPSAGTRAFGAGDRDEVRILLDGLYDMALANDELMMVPGLAGRFSRLRWSLNDVVPVQPIAGTGDLISAEQRAVYEAWLIKNNIDPTAFIDTHRLPIRGTQPELEEVLPGAPSPLQDHRYAGQTEVFDQMTAQDWVPPGTPGSTSSGAAAGVALGATGAAAIAYPDVVYKVAATAFWSDPVWNIVSNNPEMLDSFLEMIAGSLGIMQRDAQGTGDPVIDSVADNKFRDQVHMLRQRVPGAVPVAGGRSGAALDNLKDAGLSADTIQKIKAGDALIMGYQGPLDAEETMRMAQHHGVHISPEQQFIWEKPSVSLPTDRDITRDDLKKAAAANHFYPGPGGATRQLPIRPKLGR
jgi:hypothetical protein